MALRGRFDSSTVLSADVRDSYPLQGGQQSSREAGEEGILLGKAGELRRNVVPTHSHFSGCIVQLKMTFAEIPGKTFVGTGTSWKRNNFYYIVTAAHNFIKTDVTGEKYHAQKVTALALRNGDSYRWAIPLEGWAVCPGYEDSPTIGSGRDIAVGYFDRCKWVDVCEPPGDRCGQLPITMPLTGEAPPNPDSIVNVTGYPAQYPGQMYTMKGNIRDCCRTRDGMAVLLYRNIDTSGGQSGSPLMEETRAGYIIRGVHVGTDGINNIATLVSAPIGSWLRSELGTIDQMY